MDFDIQVVEKKKTMSRLDMYLSQIGDMVKNAAEEKSEDKDEKTRL